jgi:hypothetical protein
MGGSIYRDLLRRVDNAVTLNELRALRRFCRRRLEGDERLPELEEAVERKAMKMIAESEAAVRESGAPNSSAATRGARSDSSANPG